MERIWVVLLAGGKGERLWPLSREDRPKQFLPLAEGRPLIASTRERFAFIPPDRMFVVAPETQRPLFARYTPDLPVLGEPEGKNTFPAVVLATLEVLNQDPEGLLFIAPADHVIVETQQFRQAVEALKPFVEEGWIGTIGIRPTRPETGYGYIQPGPVLRDEPPRVFRLERFHEKPEETVARTYLSQGFFWNSGMFFWKARTFMDEVLRRFPQVESFMGCNPREIARELYTVLPATSVDYAVMEHTRRGVVVEGLFTWEDVGSFASLWRVLPRDDAGNVRMGEVVVEETRNSLIWAEEGKLVVEGLEGMAVVASGGITVVFPLDHAQRVKELKRKAEGETR